MEERLMQIYIMGKERWHTLQIDLGSEIVNRSIKYKKWDYFEDYCMVDFLPMKWKGLTLSQKKGVEGGCLL